MQKEKKLSLPQLSETVENLRLNSLLFFAYDFEDNENLSNENLFKLVSKLSDILNNIFSLSNEVIPNQDGNYTLSGINDIQIKFSKSKTDTLKNLYITNITLENLNVDIKTEEKHFLQTFFYILKNLENVNINYIDDSFTDILEKDYNFGHKKCEVGEVCDFIQGFKEKFLEENNETDKYLELIKILHKENFGEKDLQNLEKLLNDDLFINEKNEILELVKDLDIKKILYKKTNGKDLTKKEEKLLENNFLKIKEINTEHIALEEDIEKIKNLKKELFIKYKNKLISREFQKLLNFYLELQRIIISRVEPSKQYLMSDDTEERKNLFITEYINFSEEINSSSDKAMKTLLIVLNGLSGKINGILKQMEKGNFSFFEDNNNFAEKIILETEKQVKKIPGLFQQIMGNPIIKKMQKILGLGEKETKETKETKEQKEKREIEEFFDFALKILSYIRFLEQNDDENLETKLKEKIELDKKNYQDNDLIQKSFLNYIGYYCLSTRKYNPDFTKIGKDKIKEEDKEIFKNFSQEYISLDIGSYIDVNYIEPFDLLYFKNYSDLEEIFDKYEEFKKLLFLSKRDFLYNKQYNKYYKILYLKESFICEKSENSIEYGFPKDKNLEQRIKTFFIKLKQSGKIKNIIDVNDKFEDENGVKQKILFNIELNDSSEIEIKLIDGEIIVLGIDENFGNLDKLEEFFEAGEKQSLKNLQTYIKTSVEYILEEASYKAKDLIPNFSNNKFIINTQKRIYDSIENLIKDNLHKKDTISYEYIKNYFLYEEGKIKSGEEFLKWNRIFSNKISINGNLESGFNSYNGIFNRLGNDFIIKFISSGNTDFLKEGFQENNLKVTSISNNINREIYTLDGYEIMKFLLDIDYENLKNGKEILYEKFYKQKNSKYLKIIKGIKYIIFNEKRLLKYFYIFENKLKEKLLKFKNNSQKDKILNYLKGFIIRIIKNKNKLILLNNENEINLLYDNLFQILRKSILETGSNYIDLEEFPQFFIKIINDSELRQGNSYPYYYKNNYFHLKHA